VVKSARVMKKSVAWLEPFMELEKVAKAETARYLAELESGITPNPIILREGFSYIPHPDLSDEERRVEYEFAAMLAGNLATTAAQYEAKFGSILAPDRAQELSPLYNESRQKWSLATLEPACAFIEWLFHQKIQILPAESQIVFNVGGQESKKTTDTAMHSAENVALTIDASHQNSHRSLARVRDAIEAGHVVQARYVFYPWQNAVENTIRRACVGDGHLVPLKHTAKEHFQAPHAFLDICQNHQSHPRFVSSVIDNSVIPQPVMRDNDWLRSQLYPSIDFLLENARNYAATELQNLTNRIDETVRELLLDEVSEERKSRDRQRAVDRISATSGRGEGSTIASAQPSALSSSSAGKFLIATVKGDVHDIGKNIVGVVLSCNGFEVTDMGVMVSCDKILAKAREIGADIIGLSGLITPSLDEMVHVAKEMEKLGMTTPLLIGGATTSAAHTAIKIAPHYSGPVFHVLDASRSVPVTTSLLSADQRETFARSNREKQQAIRIDFDKGTNKKPTISLEQARANKFTCDWQNYQPAVPEFLGTRVIENQSLRELANYIDWTPFFHAWEIRGVWQPDTQTLKTQNAEGAAEAQKLHAEALTLIERIISEKRFTARGIYGFFPANAEGDDIIVWTDEQQSHERCRLHTLRQQLEKTSGKPHVALADFVKPVADASRLQSSKSPQPADHQDHQNSSIFSEKRLTSATDYVGGFVLGIHGADEFARELEEQNDPYTAIMVKAVADRFAEAFAELLHHRARVEWGYERPNEFNHNELIKELYRGIRPAPGYPAQPDHTEKPILFDLLDATTKTGVSLTESNAMHPASAVSGIYFSHPESHYFALSELQRDQVEDYARRKNMTLEEAERWLGPWLGY